jgi:hypothetical protein
MDEKVMRKFLLVYLCAQGEADPAPFFGHTTMTTDGPLTEDVIAQAAQRVREARGVESVVILNVVPLEG